jgi:hypothetical protein
MVNSPDSVNISQASAVEALRQLVSQVPVITLKDIEITSPPNSNRRIDMLVHIDAHDQNYMIVCEAKAQARPRDVRLTVYQLRDYISRLGKNAIPMLIAPYLSPDAQHICIDHNVAFLDLEGNARLTFDGVFIERSVQSGLSHSELRKVKSIFKPKAARILRLMLRDPDHTWRFRDLAKAAGVSLGQVSKVSTALMSREWAKPGEGSKQGIQLAKPDAILDEWRLVYGIPDGERISFYTVLHGASLEKEVRNILSANSEDGRAILASLSAAQWLAPYARTALTHFYADELGIERIKSALKLSSAAKGENMVIVLPRDEGIFRDAVEPAPGIVCTSPVQTYLDLSILGDRGREAAEHLRSVLLRWKK